ncbi:lamin tail domain-containing protein [Patescibacteria group bacterium]|nr:lamin tail domain-containing protein [Patescibacteria group bacterium]
MYKMKGAVLLFSLLTGVLSPFFVYSESLHLVINEVLYDPNGSDLGNEWIELYNPTSNIIDLANWAVESGGSSFGNILTFENVTIQPQSFFVIGEMNISEANLIVDELKFQNGGSATDGIRIVDQNGQVIDTLLYDEPNTNQLLDDSKNVGTNFAPDASSGSSLGRDNQSTDTDNCTSDFIEYTVTSLGTENIIILPNEAPVADAGSNQKGVVNEEIQFDASDSFDPNEDPISYSWDFGDGTGSNQIAPVHRYGSPDNYLVDLVVSDGELQDSDSITVSITEAPITPPPGGYPIGVVINELLPNPTGSDSEGEFIELHNISDNTISLSGWQLGDSSSSIYCFEDQLIKSDEYLAVFREDSGIALNNSGGDQAVLYHPDGEIVNGVEYTGSAAEGKSYSLLGSGEWVWSKPSPGASNSVSNDNNAPEAKIDAPPQAKVNQEITFDASDSADPDGDSMQFAWDFGDGQNGEGSEIVHQFSKPGAYTVTLTATDEYQAESKNSVVIQISDYDYSEKILINEVMANVAGSDSDGEWVELVNLDDREIDLAGWKLTDSKTDYIFPAESLLGAGEYLIIARQESKITLNNSADSILLINPREEIVNGVEYIKAPEDISFSRKDFSDQWLWTEKPTPGVVNEFVETENQSEEAEKAEKEESDEVMIADIQSAKKLTKGTYVQITGWVTVEPGVLATQKFYIADQQAGVQVYSSKKDFPELSLGDFVQVTGKLSEASGEKKVNISISEDIMILEAQEIIPNAVVTEIIDESYEGMLVTIEGPITEKKGKSFYVDYGAQEEIKVSIKATTDIKNLDLEEGQMVQVTGIVNQSNDIYQILPRYQDDIVFPEVLGESSELSDEETTIAPVEENNELIKYLIVVGMGAIIVIAGLLAKKFGLIEKIRTRLLKK